MPEQPLSLVSQGEINSVNLMLGFMPEEGQSLMATALAPNATNFNNSLNVLLGFGAVNQSQINDIAASGLWDVPKDYNNVYNATVNLVTDAIILCYSTEFVSAGSSPAGNPNAFDSLWVYEHQRVYALSYYDYYGLCTFPVGKPGTPYYRCHSGDLYEVFGTYYLFDQPVRVVDDIYYTNAVQDIWTAFARTSNPNPDKAYLAVRGYNSTAEFFDTFKLEEYGSKTGELAKLQWPHPWYDSIPDQDHCRVMSMVF
jgi:carboxylesterase type B